ncbi:hypothetical protein COP2_011974 [Malus domestica]
MALEEISSPIQDQASTALGSTSTVSEESRKPSSFFVHRSSKIKPRRPLDQQSSTFKPKPQQPLGESVHRSSTVHPQGSSPNGPFGLTTSTNPLISVHQVQASTALEESVHRSSPFFEIKPKSPRRSVQAQKLSKIRLSLFFEFKPKSPRKSIHHCSSRSSPKAFEDPSITILQDQAQKPLKIRSSSFIQDQASTALGSIAHPTNQHLTEIESEDQN